MNEYHIYFEIFGKKMGTSIFADSEQLAIKALRQKIEIYRIELVVPPPISDKDKDMLSNLMNIMGLK